MNEIESVISQLEQQRDAIERALAALRDIAPAAKKLGRPPGKKARGGKGHMSAEGRARIGEATRRRWAEKRAAEAAPGKKTGRPAKKASGGKRSISPEGRARIAEAARRMWAAKKAGTKTAREKAVAAE